jgi:ketopantoate hydroxymethyltransferase
MNGCLYRYKLWGWLTAALTIGLVLGFLGRERAIASERLLDQAETLSKIARDAMLHRATPERIAERVKTESKTPVDFGQGNSKDTQTQVVVLPDETGIFGLGARWILHLKVGADGRCDQAWMEMQPVGYP